MAVAPYPCAVPDDAVVFGAALKELTRASPQWLAVVKEVAEAAAHSSRVDRDGA